MAMRQVVSYDDIAVPNAAPNLGASIQSNTTPGPPPKKRKVNGAPKNANARPAHYPQHWDEPDSSALQINYDDGVGDAATQTQDVEEGEEEEEESRELTHEEIWDDSALVDAWDSAMAEYEAYHGKGGKWKEQPAKRSPLWYVVPPESSGKKAKGKAKEASSVAVPNGDTSHREGTAQDDSTPLNFDTFVPTHDPSLSAAQPRAGSDHADYALPQPGTIVGQDEAFSRALSAMYWSGYWTAVYHYHRAGEQATKVGEDTLEGEEDEGGDQDEMLPAQR